MTHTQTCPNCFAWVKKKWACPAEVGAPNPLFEKSTTELKRKRKLLRCKSTIQIVSFNVKTLNRIGQLPELTASTVDHDLDIVCVGYHLPFQHNELFHQPYMAVAEISLE